MQSMSPLSDDTSTPKNLEFSHHNLMERLIRGNEKIIGDMHKIGSYYALQQIMPSGIKGNSSHPEYFIFLAKSVDSSLRAVSSEDGRKFQAGKLKFHVTLPENDLVARAKGWDIVKDILIKHDVRYSKVVTEDIKISTKDPAERGRDITIYPEYNLEKTADDWKTIFQEITSELTNAQVPPGYKTLREEDAKDSREKFIADSAITGSNYVSYRYQGTPPEDDPIKKIVVHVEHQMKPQPWESKDLTEQNTEKQKRDCNLQ